jgi:hypothetical protein
MHKNRQQKGVVWQKGRVSVWEGVRANWWMDGWMDHVYTIRTIVQIFHRVSMLALKKSILPVSLILSSFCGMS